jgi:hypothetical protein
LLRKEKKRVVGYVMTMIEEIKDGSLMTPKRSKRKVGQIAQKSQSQRKLNPQQQQIHAQT